MRHTAFHLALAALALAACEGRELAVFELPARAGSAGNAGSAGSAGAASGGAAGTNSSMSGASSGGSSTGGTGGFGGTSASAGQLITAGMSGVGDATPKVCSADDDCMPGWLCEMKGCQATTGVCVPWPIICPPDPSPVCGCNGVTYWNDCTRLQTRVDGPNGPSHAQFDSVDPCRATACTCEVGADCMVPYASCSHLLPGETCGHGMGACWVLPPQCPQNADSKMWRECKPPEPGMSPKCLDTCQAIASEHSYAELHRGDTCN